MTERSLSQILVGLPKALRQIHREASIVNPSLVPELPRILQAIGERRENKSPAMMGRWGAR